MNKYETEIPKYLKQKESNISKANKKSKHKHQIHTSLNSYCVVCGKIKGYLQSGKYHTEIEELQKERQKGKPYWVGIPEEEIYERYHDKLPVFFVEDIYKEKYVDLKKENNTENSEGE